MTSCGNVYSAGKLTIKNAWVREAPPVAKNIAAYAELRNIGDEALTIVSVKSELFEKVEMHITAFSNGMMRMKEVKALKIVPGETSFFEPGGKHFMLKKPKQPIKAGLSIPMKFIMQSGETRSFKLIVRK